jgi:hypothetical protein
MKDLLSFCCYSTLNKQREIKIHLAGKILFSTSVANLPKRILVIYLSHIQTGVFFVHSPKSNSYSTPA